MTVFPARGRGHKGPGLAILLALAVFGVGPASAASSYWEYPRTLASGRFPLTLQLKDGFVLLWQESLATSAPGAAQPSGQASLRMARFLKGRWEDARTITRASYIVHYDANGREPVLFSAAVSGDDRIAVAIAAGEGRIDLLVSPDGGASFAASSISSERSFSVAPRIYASASGGWLLFVAQGDSGTATRIANPSQASPDQGEAPGTIFPIFSSRSQDGREWTAFSPLLKSTETGIDLSFNPVAAPLPQAAGSPPLDIMVFQGLTTTQRPSWQLFFKLSPDGGRTWSAASRLTSFPDPLMRDQTAGAADNFDSRGASLGLVDGGLWIVWQKASRGSPQTQVYMASFTPSGSLDLKSVDRVSSGSGTCILPQVVSLDGRPAATWVDNRTGSNHMYLNPKGITRDETNLSQDAGSVAFGRIAFAEGRSYAFWQVPATGRDRIVALEPDTHVDPPRLTALDFSPGTRTARERATIKLLPPTDSSGILGFSYVWSRDPAAEPPHQIMGSPTEAETRLSMSAREDGPWFLSAEVQDIAGNWSQAMRISYVRKLTPPRPPLVFHPDLDENGFLASNTFTVRWGSPEKEPIAGYTWELRYAGGLEGAPVLASLKGRPQAPSTTAPLPGLAAYESSLVERAGPPLPPRRILGSSPNASWNDIDDGYYLLSVAAVDDVGNISDTTSILLRANKYVPYTLISFSEPSRDDLGRTALSIIGKGFAADGEIERVVLDRDGREPYDIERDLGKGGFRIRSDTQLDSFSFEDAEAGMYRIGLYHPKRGWYWTSPKVAIDISGTIKYGVEASYVPSWLPVAPRVYRFSVYDAVILVALLFGGLGVAISSSQAIAAVRDGAAVRLQVQALVYGGPMPASVKTREERKLSRRGVGLQVKFTLFIALLALFVVFLVSLPLGVSVTRAESASLARGLQQRALVLLESVGQGARTYLPNQDTLQLGFLPQQKQAMEDAKYVTITGYAKKSTEPDAVWASNDPALATKIDTTSLDQGASRISDALSPKIAAIVSEIDAAATAEVGDINKSITDLNREAIGLATRIATDENAKRRFEEISQTVTRLRSALNDRLFALASKSVGSVPAFDPNALDLVPRRYVFYKPVLYVQTNDQLYYRGMVRIEVSTDRIVADVKAAQANIIRITLIIAAVALGIGIAGSFLLSLIIVIPISKLLAQIEHIRDTPDKEDLAGERIEVSSRDELFRLAEAVNQMTEGLVKAAKASKELIVGKGIQKMFIPLDAADSRAKLSTGSRNEKDFEVFGYYEGAKGVSGDYWDFRSINNRYHYFIKCDISGKGVSAALIMVEVATMVINYFNEWKKAMPRNIDLTGIAYRINDFIEERGYEGKRFAAFTLGLWDSQDGKAYLCEAGDRKLHTWNAREERVVEDILADSPAAGIFPSFMVQMKTPYVQITRPLESGDILLLYTDGIEEAKRHFRDASFKVITCEDVEKEQVHGNHSGGQDNEEFGYDRLTEVLAAVNSKGKYRLVKAHDPVPKSSLSFDFSTCSGGLEEKIIALVAVEKVFRMYPDPTATDKDVVLVDQKIDAFLEKHFDQYRLYCSKKLPNIDPQKENPGYLLYAGIREDDQYDDLTILGIRRK